MTSALRTRLVRLLGMLGSSHDGERANAAALADRLIHDAGLVWEIVIAPAIGAEPAAAPEPADDLAPREHDVSDLEWLDRQPECLSERQSFWVARFRDYLAKHDCLTAKQREVLDDIVRCAKQRCGRAA